MNYHNIYNKLIHKARERTLCGYTEQHHIVPKSLGGSNETENLVHLSAREHYIAHRLLVKIYKDSEDRESYKKMVYAMWFLSKTLVEQRQVSSRAYETARIAFSINNPNKDEERKKKLRALHKSGTYNAAYAKKSVDMKITLSALTPVAKELRTRAARGCNQEQRANAIKKSKASLLLLTRLDTTTQQFWSYDDIRLITGKSYDSVKAAIRKNNGWLSNGNRVEFINRYNTINRYNKDVA
jgi:hypothetical protein